MASDLGQIVEASLTAAMVHRGAGRVADYIPALADVDPSKFGLALATVDGACHVAGDADHLFSIQSISKVFTLSLALNRMGERLWSCVGREPSGTPFNSIVQLESEKGVPRNPFINAGAIAVTDQFVGQRPVDEAVDELVRCLRRCAEDTSISYDPLVAMSEAEAGSRNRSLAHFMASFGRLTNRVETALTAYFRQCALAMSCRQLARAGLFLANRGRHPATGEPIVSPERARQINALMLSCGHYDNSGDFAFRVGLPGKSGVGGGILVIAPGRGALAAWSPGLNGAGTSLAGSAAIEHFARTSGWSVFA